MKIKNTIYRTLNEAYIQNANKPKETVRARRNNNSGIEYMLLIYGKQAQEFIVQNIERILCSYMQLDAV